jgi:hypothetical protein
MAGFVFGRRWVRMLAGFCGSLNLSLMFSGGSSCPYRRFTAASRVLLETSSLCDVRVTELSYGVYGISLMKFDMECSNGFTLCRRALIINHD